MKTYTKQELKVIIEKHGLWLNGDPKGEKANLRYADLRYANLSSANLNSADLNSANLNSTDLSSANLREADLNSANLSCANLRYADLREADLRYANLNSANLSCANLRYADLRYANLHYANLRDANLRYARGNDLHIKTIHCGTYDIAYTSEILQIGCQNHKIKQWWEFSDQEISEMDEEKALDWWRLWKPTIKRIIKISPAQDTGHENENN